MRSMKSTNNPRPVARNPFAALRLVPLYTILAVVLFVGIARVAKATGSPLCPDIHRLECEGVDCLRIPELWTYFCCSTGTSPNNNPMCCSYVCRNFNCHRFTTHPLTGEVYYWGSCGPVHASASYGNPSINERCVQRETHQLCEADDEGGGSGEG